MRGSPPILVVGAGPVGLTTALLLAKHHVPVRIVEKNLEGNRGTRGAALMPRTLELYQLLGCMPEMIKRQTLAAVSTLLYKIPGGTEVAREVPFLIEKLPPDQTRPYDMILAVSQQDQEEILRLELEKHGCLVEFGKELVEFRQNENGVTASLLVHSREGQITPETIHASYLIGTDGGKSVVRKQLAFNFLGSTMEADGMITANATVSGLRADVAHAWRFPDGLFFGYRPYNTESRKFVIAVMGRSDLQHHSTPDGIRELLRTHIGREDILPDSYDWVSYYQPSIRLVESFSQGRAFLAGDAAHVHPPHGGQGLNSGIQDAFCLAWKLAMVYKGHSPPRLLQTYDEERLPVLTEMLRQVLKLYQVAQTDNNYYSSGNRPFWKEKQMMMLGVNYRWSSIVRDNRFRNNSKQEVDNLRSHAYLGSGEILRAGDRAPDAQGLQDKSGRTLNLFDLLSCVRHTLLVFAGKDGHALSERSPQIWPSNTIETKVISATSCNTKDLEYNHILDAGGNAFDAYQMDREDCRSTFVLIRPDGFIGFIGHSMKEFEEYSALVLA